MEIEQKRYSIEKGWENIWDVPDMHNKCGLVLGFGSPDHVKSEKNYKALKEFYPDADIILTSTAGEILDGTVDDDTLSISALSFSKTPLEILSQSISDPKDTYKVCEELSKGIPKKDLKHIIALSDGLRVNGSELIRGLRTHIHKEVGLTGGLAGDGVSFGETFIGHNQAAGSEKRIVIIGLYGDAIQIGSGSVGGWDNFGIKRIVTKSKGNIVYTLDNKPILDLYKEYLGDVAKDLPGSGLLFPLTISASQGDNSVVRTLLGVDEEKKSITFAGDVPEGYSAQLMKANFDRLIDGAGDAANNAQVSLGELEEVDFALLISCVGRKLILKQRVEEEIENVRSIIGPAAKIAGFYSYGEIGPAEQEILDCKLHNQTMTITLFHET